MLLDERIRSDGSLARLHAERDGDRVTLVDDDGASGAIPARAIGVVMARYGRPLELGVTPEYTDALDLPGGARLRRMKFHAIVDATGRDYLVWEAPGAEPIAAIATTVAAALRYLIASKN